MFVILFWVLSAYGLTSILIWGSIFDKPRDYIKTNNNFFGTLISCVLCTSTWVGFLMSFIFGGLCEKIFNSNYFIGLFFDGMFTAGSVWAINSIIEFFEESRIK
jgi:hypothetical protein